MANHRATLLKKPRRSGIPAALVLAAALLCAGLSHSATTTPGEVRLLAGGCDICHGPDGISHGPAIPTIAGLSSEYLYSTLEGFQRGEIPSTVMGRLIQGYRSEELQALATYYSRKPFGSARQPYDPRLAEQGGRLHGQYCEKCHTRGGRSVEDDAGRLAGQWQPYLAWTLQDFRSGRRPAVRKMQQRLERLHIRKGRRGLTALLHYYASQQE